MCYSLRATVASWALGTHSFIWLAAWLGATQVYTQLETVALLASWGWVYYALQVQLVDLAAWLLLERNPALGTSDTPVVIPDSEQANMAGLWLTMTQPISAAVAATVIAFSAAVEWAPAILSVTMILLVGVLFYTFMYARAMTPNQKIMCGSLKKGLVHSWWELRSEDSMSDDGLGEYAVAASYVYNGSQVIASLLTITVAIAVLEGYVQAVILVVTGFFWATGALSLVSTRCADASRVSTTWCWYVGGALFVGTTLVLWPRDHWDPMVLYHLLGALLVLGGVLLWSQFRGSPRHADAHQSETQTATMSTGIPLLTLRSMQA